MRLSLFLSSFLGLSSVNYAQGSSPNYNFDRPQSLSTGFPPFTSGNHTLNFDASGSEFNLHSRQRRSPGERIVIRCDFSQGSNVCVSCKRVRRCYPFNYGTITTCFGIFPYCRFGRCSTIPGALCTTTTTSSSSSSSASTSASGSTTESTTSAAVPSTSSSTSISSTTTTPPP